MLKKTSIKILILFISITSFNSIYSQSKRAMWVWNNANQVNNIINDIGDYRKELYEFIKAPHNNPQHNISTLFFSCREGLFLIPDKLRGFLSEISDSGVTMEYLDGDPTWATYNKNIGYYRIEKVIDFNKNSIPENEKIKGIQFDVEPYLLTADRGYQPPYWDTERMEVWESFIEFLDSCQTLVNNSGDDLYFGVAIPRWYENHVGLDELKRLQGIVDYVAVMDYNENPDVIIRDAENEIKNAEELNKEVWIGVETKEVYPETVSFAEEGVAYMEEQLIPVVAAYISSPVFKGIAIHSYKYYKDLFYEPVAVKKNDFLIPGMPILGQNYPNPFNPSTNIEFYLPESGKIDLTVYNALGEKELVIISEIKSKGWHKVSLSYEDFKTGVYFYELVYGSNRLMKKMLLIK
jgi:hypothetical protein